MPTRFVSLVFVLLAIAAATAYAQAPSLPPKALEISRLLRASQIDPAVAKVEAWSAAEPGSALAWLWAGRAYARQAMAAGMLSKMSWATKTRNAYEKAVALDAKLVDARIELLQYYVMAPGFMGGDVEKAKQQAREIAALDAARGHAAEGIIALSAKDEARAEREFRAALEIAPDDNRTRSALSGFLAGNKRWADIRAMCDGILAKNPDDAWAHYQLGRTAALSGEQLEAGLEHLTRYLALPEHPEDLPLGGAYWRRAQILEKLGRKAEALAQVRTAVELEPGLEDAKKDLKRLGG